MTLAEIMLPEFDAEMARTRKILADAPADRMDWKPAEGLHAIGWNANHLADLVGWAPLILTQPEFDMAPVDGPAPVMASESDPAKILEQFDANVAAARQALADASDAVMAEPWSLKSGGQTLFTISKGDCLRTWVFNHCVHHRAILSVYLRMCGVDSTPVYDS